VCMTNQISTLPLVPVSSGKTINRKSGDTDGK